MKPLTKLTTTFLAIEIPDQLCERLTKIQKKLNKINNQIIWELPEKLHVTFVYLGRISDIEKQKMLDILVQETKEQLIITAHIGYLGYFYKKHATGIVWIGVETKGELEKLHKRLIKSLNQAGFSLSDKKLIPHITLGRLKKIRGKQQMNILDKLANSEIPGIDNLGKFEIRSITAFTSHYVKEINTTELIKTNEVFFKE